MSDKKLERAYEGWHLYKGFYGNVKSVEAVFYPKTSDFYIGVGLNIGFDGNYQFRFTDKFNDEAGRCRIMIARRYATIDILESTYIDINELGIGLEGPIKLQLQYENGILTGSVNDVALIDYDTTGSVMTFEAGYGGVWTHPEFGVEYSDFKISGVTIEKLNERYPDVRSNMVYDLQIEDLQEDTTPPCWSTEPYKAQWTIQNRKGQKVFYVPNNGQVNKIHLHVFENMPHLKLRLAVNNMEENGSFGVLIRHAPDTAYVKVGYNAKIKKWFIEDTPALYDCKTSIYYSEEYSLTQEKEYLFELEAEDDRVTVHVNGACVLATEGIRHTGFGRIGLFAEHVQFSIYDMHAEIPHATSPVDGVVKYVAVPDIFGTAMEIEELDDGTLIGVRRVLSRNALIGDAKCSPEFEEYLQTKAILRSDDGGLSFYDTLDGGEFAGLATYGNYQSIIRLKNGKYLQVLIYKKLEVQISDDLIHWETIGRVLSDEQIGSHGAFFHVSSLAEYTLPDGKNRLFLPVCMRGKPYENEITPVKGHNTYVCYSDDGGRTWSMSETCTDDLIRSTSDFRVPDMAESKIVMCSDYSMRLYNTRNTSRFMCYTESFDFGKTWSRLYPVKEMQCAKSSFSVCEDRYEPGTYYLVWVNDEAFCRGTPWSRTRLSLAKSTDGKNWKFLCDCDHMSVRFADEPADLYVPLFQFVDPVITTTKEHIIVDSGLSMYTARERVKPGCKKAVHHEQRTAITRLTKSCLTEKPWDATTVCNMSLVDGNTDSWL